ncbi:MAG TPA: zinc ribbon domain-containing protein [Longimicrobium sp.]|jgi:ribosomal protein L40E
MGTFQSSRFFPISPPDLKPVGGDVLREFRGRGFEVKGEQGLTGGWFISIHKGGTFKAVVGMKTALNIKIEPVDGGTQVDAGIGIFGQQAIPTLITSLVFWPVLITQIAGMVQSAKLDDEAIQIVEAALIRHSGGAQAAAAPLYATPTPAPPVVAVPQAAAPGAPGPAVETPRAGAPAPQPAAAEQPREAGGGFCSECGTRLPAGAKFCNECGTRVTVPA